MQVFADWPNGLLPGAKEMLECVKKKYSIACLSNTNALHWQNQKDADYLNVIFDTMFLSYQMGLVKPDANIYMSMIDHLSCSAHEILFIDDNQINIDGARNVGITAHRAKGIKEVTNVLSSHGCI